MTRRENFTKNMDHSAKNLQILSFYLSNHLFQKPLGSYVDRFLVNHVSVVHSAQYKAHIQAHQKVH